MRNKQDKKRACDATPEPQHDSEQLLRQANEQLVVAALAAKEAAQREQVLRQQLQAQNEKLQPANGERIAAS